MKLATYRCGGSVSFGVVTPRGIVDIPSSSSSVAALGCVEGILAAGREALAEAADLARRSRKLLRVEDIQLLPPVQRPGKLIGLAGNYTKHIIEAGAKLGLSDSPHETTVPRPFLMPPTVLTAPGAEIPFPCCSRQIDYEIELAVVIGARTRCVEPQEALAAVGGYTIANDVSARSVTFKAGRAARPWDEFFDWLNGKWADGFLPLGPCLVTPDEAGGPQNLSMELRVNSETRQWANCSQMIFSVAEIVSFLSHLMTLEPGDIIATGTPEGVGMASGRYLGPGDRIECTIDNLGTLSNTIGPMPVHFYEPLAKG